ncbi:hypothetical protein [Methylocystis echinoides]|jgi:hypothetical protein|uniref:hypothetical protein n=1 Tax=Methylocystis echinoides TaxID=29468 RepID=UPI0034253B89
MNIPRPYRDSRDDERAFHKIRIASSGSAQTISDSVLHDMATLDSKSAALLQFISVVLAALTFSLGLVDGGAPYAHVIRAGVFAFMGVFGFAAWADLRCLKSIGPARLIYMQSAEEFENAMLTEISERRDKYLLSLRVTEIAFMLLALFILLWVLFAARAHSIF